MTKGRCNTKWDSIIHGSIWRHEHDTRGLQPETVCDYCSGSVLPPPPVCHPCVSDTSGLEAIRSMFSVALHTCAYRLESSVLTALSYLVLQSHPSCPGQQKVAMAQCQRKALLPLPKGENTTGGSKKWLGWHRNISVELGPSISQYLTLLAKKPVETLCSHEMRSHLISNKATIVECL